MKYTLMGSLTGIMNRRITFKA